MVPNQTLTELSARVLGALDRHRADVEGDFIVVQGDTTTACMAAYWAFCSRIPVAHVEAGLRTYDLSAPSFPKRPTGSSSAASRGCATSWPRPSTRPRRLSARISAPACTSSATPRSTPSSSSPNASTTVISPSSTSSTRRWRALSADRAFDLGHRASARGVLAAASRVFCEGIRELADRHDDVRVVYPVRPSQPQCAWPGRETLGQTPADPALRSGALRAVRATDAAARTCC